MRTSRILSARVVTQLPIDPNRSDVEVFLDPTVSSVLTEDERQSLAGAMASTMKLLDGLGKELKQVWEWRRANPAQLTQPKRQCVASAQCGPRRVVK